MLTLAHVKKNYHGTAVLRDINLTVERGEIIAILGPSGCGKTTLLNLILGTTPLSGGSISLDGKDITRMPMEKRPFNIVFQDYALFPHLNARQNILYGLKNKPGTSTPAEVDALVALLELEPHLEKRIDQLSGGQKQRVALARTLVMKPQLLLLDEPFSALDCVIRESIKARIRRIATELGLTILIVTHDPEEALTLADRVLVLNQGEIADFTTPKEIVRDRGNEFVKNFIVNQLTIRRRNLFSLFEACNA